MLEVDVLVPTCDRPAALAVTLAGLAAQRSSAPTAIRVIVSDQGDTPVETVGEVQAMTRVLAAHGRDVEIVRHLPRRGMAEQRQFLLDRARAPYALFVDDDVFLEPDVLDRLLTALVDEGCGFAGCGLIGLSFLDDVRPHQQGLELWDGPVVAEVVTPESSAWQRHHLHSAANLWHVQQRLGLHAARELRYRVAWIGGCVLYDVAKLRECGGFTFWRDLPAVHCGEDVLAQLRLLARYGGFGLLPSGAYHLEVPTTLADRRVDAPRVLPIVPTPQGPTVPVPGGPSVATQGLVSLSQEAGGRAQQEERGDRSCGPDAQRDGCNSEGAA